MAGECCHEVDRIMLHLLAVDNRHTSRYSPRHFRGFQQPEASSLVEGNGLAQCCQVDIRAAALDNVLQQLCTNVFASASTTACHTV
jgi:hypothetical protein